MGCSDKISWRRWHLIRVGTKGKDEGWIPWKSIACLVEEKLRGRNMIGITEKTVDMYVSRLLWRK